MFEKVLPENGAEIIESLSPHINDFYLAGGTGLALQLGHRKSLGLDFFSSEIFNTEVFLKNIHPDKTLLVREETIHCEIGKVKFSFLFYNQPLVFPTLTWRGIKLADWRDITAEKIKAIAQRGTKKDFYDLFAVLQLRLSIDEACGIFKKRFASTDVNMYHVLKSITFFEEAEEEPPPILLVKDEGWRWEKVKEFFEKNIKQFEKSLFT
ncbi:MAG: nucleotidyl transferase AbiEii/AbiGii toxin family protein [candidate division WOR-3 bacterium]